MLPEIHIYRSTAQPATSWVVPCTDPPIRIEWPADTMLWAQCCRRKRRADACVVHAWYAGVDVYCAPGHGCKDPAVIAAKRERARRNRSEGQKRRWERVRHAG